MTLALYRLLTASVSPFIPFYLRLRRKRGKEDALRLRERLGYAPVPRPAGKLIWLHAASVGEANSVQPLIEALKRRYPKVQLLLTTGTVTSATLMRARLPEGVIHQYVPVDTPAAVKRFMVHWQPDAGLLVESELWPGLLSAAHAAGCRMALINARMSKKSFRNWNKFRSLARTMLGWFEMIYAQSEEDAAHFRALGASRVECLGNLKYDGAPLAADAENMLTLQNEMGFRPRWLAASIHPGEDNTVAKSHQLLLAAFPDLLTVIVPRHPQRSTAMRIKCESAGLRVALRSANEPITPEVSVYIADTLGELGLFYRLCPITFIGGSLIPHGGQNPLEPARLGCAILFGPNMFNFAEVAQGLLAASAALEVRDAATLAEGLRGLLNDARNASAMGTRASAWAIGKAGVNERLLEHLAPLIEDALRHAA